MMKKPIAVLIMAVVILGTVFAGCSDDGGDDGKNGGTKGLEEIPGTPIEEVGWADAGEGMEPVEVSKKVTVSIPNDKVVSVSVSIEVTESDESHDDSQTQPDSVTGGTVSGENNASAAISGGATPFSTTVDLTGSAEDGSYVGSAITVDLKVSCVPSEDTWPGPMIWSGYYDTGFGYKITVNYKYMGDPTAPGAQTEEPSE